MAGPFLVPCNKPLRCPSDDKLYVKHVILKKDIIPNPQPREVKNCLMINQLLSEAGGRQNMWNKLLIVEFSSYSEDEINNILSKGVEFDGSRYCFLGFSASQLRTKTCFLINETEKEVSVRRAMFGIPSDAISFTDRAAKIQHMFEPFERSVQLNENEFKFKSNAGTNVRSGLMSPELTETIKTTCGLSNAPSVVQVICPGFSGKLVRCDEISSVASEDVPSSRGIKALMRIPDAEDNYAGKSLTMGIADCAKPYKMGYLDVFSVMFLDELGVRRDYLLELQSGYHKLLEKLGKADLTYAKYFLRFNGREELLSKIEKGMTSEAREKICMMKSDEINEMKDHDGRAKLRVPVIKSREVFGIVDPYHDNDSALKPDECFFIPCLDCLNPQEQEEFKKADQVLVIPLPCYTSSGIRVLKLMRDKGEYENLKDCLVFSSPTEEQVVANKYFVCWDENLIGQKSKSFFENISSALPCNWRQCWKKLPTRLPCSGVPSLVRHKFDEMVTCKDLETDGPSTKSKLQENEKFQNYLKEYFSTFKSNDRLVSQASSLFESFASHTGWGPSCSECQKLGEYLSPDFSWNATSYGVVEKYLKKLDEKFEELSSDQKEAQDSAAQSSTSQPVWKEMTAILNNFTAPGAQQNGIL